MSIVRVSKRERFVVIDKTGVEDPAISFRATGLLVYLLSKPDDWTISYRALARVKTEGEHAVLTALGELETAGYLKRERRRGEGGRIEWEQVLYECPTCDQDGTMPRKSPHGVTSDDADHAAGNHAAVVQAAENAALTEEGHRSTDTESRAPRKTQIPDGWTPSPELVADLKAKHPTVDVEGEVEGFRDYHGAKGSKFVKWDLAFRTWIRNTEKFAARDQQRNGGRLRVAGDPNDAWAGEEATV